MDLRVKHLKIRTLPRPEEGLRVLAEHAPQAEAFMERTADRIRPTASVLYRARRRIATGGIFLLTVWLFLHVMFGANGMVIYRQKKAEYQNLRKEVDGLQKENNRFVQQIKALKGDAKTIEREAREQLHYAKPGEVIYVSPQQSLPQPQQNPNDKAARK
jgi:cell division protein FtsB